MLPCVISKVEIKGCIHKKNYFHTSIVRELQNIYTPTKYDMMCRMTRNVLTTHQGHTFENRTMAYDIPNKSF